MASIAFCTPISFGNRPQSYGDTFLETIDSYFFLGGKKATVVPGQAHHGQEGAVLVNESTSSWTTALKIITYITVVIPLILLVIKAITRSIRSFYLIDVRQKLEEGMAIGPDITGQLRQVMPTVIAGAEDPAIVWHANGNNLVFSLASLPQYVFKMANPHKKPDGVSNERFAKMEYAKAVCIAYQLDHLVIPHAMKLNINGTTIIAEERLAFNPDESAQEGLYQLPGLDETVRQLATFISVTGFSDVTPRNIPILDGAPDFPGPRRVALIDIEEMDSAVTGIFGAGEYRRGLINCLSTEAHIDSTTAIAAHHTVVSHSAGRIKAQRLEEVRSSAALQRFYAGKGIMENPRQPIQIDDLNTLGLHLDEIGEIGDEKITMRQVVADVLAQINAAIAKTPEEASVKGKRYILLNTHERPISTYLRLGLPGDAGFITEKNAHLVWIDRIIGALIDKGYLFKLYTVNAHGYWLQA